MQINRKDILKDAGKVSHELAKEVAEREYDIYHKNSLKDPSRADKEFEAFAKKTVKLISRSKKKK